MIEHKLSEEDLRRHVKCEVHLEVSSKGMEPTNFESLHDATAFMGVPKQTLTYAYKHKRLVITRWKGGAKSSSSSGLRHHNIYPSWININFSDRAVSKNLSKKNLQVKCHTVISKIEFSRSAWEYQSVPVAKLSNTSQKEIGT